MHAVCNINWNQYKLAVTYESNTEVKAWCTKKILFHCHWKRYHIICFHTLPLILISFHFDNMVLTSLQAWNRDMKCSICKQLQIRLFTTLTTVYIYSILAVPMSGKTHIEKQSPAICLVTQAVSKWWRGPIIQVHTIHAMAIYVHIPTR